METSDLFTHLLGLSYPYQVTSVETVLDNNQKQTVVILIEIDKTYRPQANLWIQGYYEREFGPPMRAPSKSISILVLSTL